MSLLDTASLIVTPNGYKEGKLYSVIPSDGSGDLSVTRATTATRVNSAGLVELVPYNLLQYSEQFDNAAWTKNNVTLTSGQSDPFGGTSAFRAQFSGVAYMLQGVSAISGTASIYARSTSGTSKIRIGDTNGNFTTQYTLTTSWQRITTSGSAIVGVSIDSFIDGGWTSQDIQVYGAQLVEGSSALPYQKTETRLNIPRLDYSNGTCPSILVEPQRTNLLTYSSSFDNAAWNNSASVTANVIVSPSGIQDADRVTGILYQFISFTNGQSYTLSFYAKKNAQSSFVMRLDAPSNNSYSYNFDTETASSGATIESVGNGWYYCTASVTASFTGTGVFYANVNSNNFYLWGAQFELGSYPTSYIPTTSASVTRNADVISKTGISSLIGQTEGTLFTEVIYDASIPTIAGGIDQPLMAISNGTNDNLIAVLLQGSNDNKVYTYAITSGAVQGIISSSAQTSGTIKIAVSYKSNYFALFVNGVKIGEDTSVNVPTTNQLNIGSYLSFGSQFIANVKASAIWKTQLTDAQCQTLTTI